MRAKTVLKINWSVKTPSHKRMEVVRSGLWAPVLYGKNVELYKPINLLFSSSPVAPDENSTTQQQHSDGSTNRYVNHLATPGFVNCEILRSI